MISPETSPVSTPVQTAVKVEPTLPESIRVNVPAGIIRLAESANSAVVNLADKEEVFREAMVAVQNNNVISLNNMLNNGLDVNLTKDYEDKRTLLWFATTNLDVTDRRQIVDRS